MEREAPFPAHVQKAETAPHIHTQRHPHVLHHTPPCPSWEKRGFNQNEVLFTGLGGFKEGTQLPYLLQSNPLKQKSSETKQIFLLIRDFHLTDCCFFQTLSEKCSHLPDFYVL